jgi:hypothetical protein
MDKSFIQRATQIASFNFYPSDFTSLKYKTEIQSLFQMHFFPTFDLKKTLKGIDKNQINGLINNLKSISSERFQYIHNYNLKGIGPGEVTLYFLIDNAHLGGGSSAGVDVIIGTKGYEVKAVKVSRDSVASDFKLGGTVPLVDIITDLYDLSTRMKLGGSRTEISGGIIDKLKVVSPKEYYDIESRFKEVAYNNYFKHHEVIFINNGTGPSRGLVESVKKVAKEDIMLERLTSGTLKPKVKL